jgi:hypothetical protein
LESILNRLLTQAKDRAAIKGAGIATLAMAAVRATREGTIVQKSERLPSIIGTPIAGETLEGRTSTARPRSRSFRATFLVMPKVYSERSILTRRNQPPPTTTTSDSYDSGRRPLSEPARACCSRCRISGSIAH